MTKTIGIHSFRRGTGKTFFAINLSLLLAQEGWRVALVDTDFQSPDLHKLFGLTDEHLPHTLNDYLEGRCSAQEIVYDVTDRLEKPVNGKVFIIPASSKLDDITQVLRKGYDVETLATGLREIGEACKPNLVVIDTSAGLTEENLQTLALVDSVAIVLLPDQQHYQGTAVLTDLAGQLNAPSVSLIVNQIPDVYNPAQVKHETENTYHTKVAAVLPFVDECSAGDPFFVFKYPTHPLTLSLMQMVLGLLK